MKYLFSCFLLSVYISASNGQSVYLKTGKIISTFHYKDSKSNPLTNLRSCVQNNLGIGFRTSIHHSKFHFSCGAAYNRYGSMGSNPVLGSYYEWDATLLGVNVGFDYEFFEPPLLYNTQKGFSFCLKTNVASEFLVSGMQNLNNQIYNLAGQEEFDRPFYFLRGGIDVNYYISKKLHVFLEYMGGINFLIGNYNNQEQLHIETHNISIGLSINFN